MIVLKRRRFATLAGAHDPAERGDGQR